MPDSLNPVDVALMGAVSSEVDRFATMLHSPSALDLFPGATGICGRVGTLRVALLVSGIGKVNASALSAALLTRYPVKSLWLVGSAGAYREGPLQVGDVLVSETIFCGDEGVLKSDGTLGNRAIGIPLFHWDEEPVFETLPIDFSPVLRRVREITPAGRYRLEGGRALKASGEFGTDSTGVREEPDGGADFRLHFGPSVTVSLVSGDRQTACDRYRMYGAWAENMEGSAVAQVCCRFRVPFLECRGISNFAGDRRKDRWRLDEALEHLYGVVRVWLETYGAATPEGRVEKLG